MTSGGSRLLRELPKEKRQAEGLSQSAVAKLFGVSRPIITYWETGPIPEGPDAKSRGKAIPEAYVPLVERWATIGQAPDEDELAAAKAQAARDRTIPKKTKWTYGQGPRSKGGAESGETV